MRLNHKRKEIPSLTTAALPDLIFTVLFFFMIATHLRKTDVQVEVETPVGTQLYTQHPSPYTLYIYIGHDNGRVGQPVLQVNNTVAAPSQWAYAIAREASLLTADSQQPLTAILNADKNMDMATVNRVRVMLQQNGVSKIHYTAHEAQK